MLLASVDVPPGLGRRGHAFFVEVLSEYVLNPVKIAVLGHICREIDLIEELHDEIDKLPRLDTRGSIGQRVIHPIVSEIRQHRSVLAGLLRRLDLPGSENLSGAPRTSWTSERARKAARARWGTPGVGGGRR